MDHYRYQPAGSCDAQGTPANEGQWYDYRDPEPAGFCSDGSPANEGQWTTTGTEPQASVMPKEHRRMKVNKLPPVPEPAGFCSDGSPANEGQCPVPKDPGSCAGGMSPSNGKCPGTPVDPAFCAGGVGPDPNGQCQVFQEPSECPP